MTQGDARTGDIGGTRLLGWMTGATLAGMAVGLAVGIFWLIVV
jgi:hypothetical protein